MSDMMSVTKRSELMSRIRDKNTLPEFGNCQASCRPHNHIHAAFLPAAVTTSFIDRQAYQEVVDDEHPVIFVSAMDIVYLLRDAGYSSPTLISSWLDGISEAI